MSVVTDPYGPGVGFSMPKVSADVVTVSHGHGDHNNVKGVAKTARRDKPFVIDAPGEYEVGGVSVFGVSTFHDGVKGKERGKNIVFSILLDGISVVHLGDLGHVLSQKRVEEINGVDVLLCPVGGSYTIGPDQATKVISALEPSFVVPMHYKTDKHDKKKFEKIAGVEEFLKEMGVEAAERADKLTVTKATLPEETKVVLLEA
jgi:L-ascorbate metabolism protein UlaG (beta-lactamase superfamily)